MITGFENTVELSKELERQRRFIADLKRESDEWNPDKDDILLRVSDLLHEGCTHNHTDMCGYYYNRKDSSYYKRAIKIKQWCEENEINLEFMIIEKKYVLKDMFK